MIAACVGQGAALRRPDVYTILLVRPCETLESVKDLAGATQNNYGDVAVTDANKKFLTSSIYFDGTGDYIKFNGSQFYFNDSDFCVEMWIYATTFNDWTNACGQWYYSGSNNPIRIGTSSGKWRVVIFNTASTFKTVTGTSSVVSGTWYHIAAVRLSSTLYLYVNGIQENSISEIGTLANNLSGVVIGAQGTYNPYPWNGQIAWIRISKNHSRYTSNFTPPTRRL